VYGKRLVRTYEVAPDALARYTRFQNKAGAAGNAGLLADTEDWRGEELDVSSAGSPYNVVVKVQGEVVADGDVSTIWQTGWTVEGTTRSNLVPEIGQKGAKAGQRFSGEGTAGPTSFKENRHLAPYLGLVRASNVKVDGVTVEVWSGFGKSRPLEKLLPWTSVLLGGVFLVLVLRNRR
jgi:hypothetical protein